MRKVIERLKYYTATLLFVLTSSMLGVSPALAANDNTNDTGPDIKVFVCKYVGTPGVDESLQTGQNPIDVSVNAIKDYNGVGSYFNDAQGRSYVLAIDTGQAEPDVSQCPAPQGPTQVPLPTPSVNDPCGADNATWVVPTDTTSVTWTLTEGDLVASTTAGFEFTDGTTTHDFGQAVDSNAECPLTPVTPTAVTFNEVCGTDNDTYTIPTTTGVDYQVGGVTQAADTYAGSGTVTVTAVAQAGFTLDGPTSWSHTFTNVPCETPPQKVFVCKYVGTPGVDERLQTGQNPIDVSVNAIAEDPVVVGSFFNDAQGRSFVLAFDVGQAEPDVSECPSVPNLVPVTPAAVTFTDATCLAPTLGSFSVPSTDHVTYHNGNMVVSGTNSVSVPSSVTITATAATGFTLSGTSSWSHNFTAPNGCGGAGQVLGTSTTTPAVAASTLANTGTSVVLPTILAISMTLTSAGLMLGSYMQRKRATSDPTLVS